ncbi:MAG: hypothetical protein ACO4CS_20030, partial [bacterium]
MSTSPSFFDFEIGIWKFENAPQIRDFSLKRQWSIDGAREPPETVQEIRGFFASLKAKLCFTTESPVSDSLSIHVTPFR